MTAAGALTGVLVGPVRAGGVQSAAELYQAAKARLRAGWLDAALEPVIADLERAHALAPDDPAILATLATALARAAFYAASGDLLARARGLAERATAAAPALGDAWFAPGVSCL